jgi:hypothetical protein
LLYSPQNESPIKLNLNSRREHSKKGVYQRNSREVYMKKKTSPTKSHLMKEPSPKRSFCAPGTSKRKRPVKLVTADGGRVK